MNKRMYDILKYIFQEKGRTSIKEVSTFANVNDRTIRYDIEKINELFIEKGISPIEKLSKGELFHKDFEKIENFIEENYKNLFFNEYRQTIILIKIAFLEEVCITDLCETFDVTRTTIKNELGEIRKILKENLLELEPTGSGLKLVGSEENIRNLQLKILNQHRNIISEKNSEKIYIFNLINKYFSNINFNEIEKFINYIAKQLNIVITDETYFILSNYILLMIGRIKKKKLIEKINNEKFYSETNEFQVLEKSISFLEANFNLEIPRLELIKLTDYFLGCSNFSLSNSAYKDWIEIEIIAKKIVLQFKKISGIDLSGDTTLMNGLVNHIKPALHRVKNGITLENSVYKEVIENYPALFNNTKETLSTLEGFTNIPINDDEIAFITLHFKGAIDRNKSNKKESKNIVLICGYGYGTSKLLEQQLKERYNINILDIIPLNQINKIDFSQNIDLIITTLNKIELDTKIPIITINTILKNEDIALLDSYNLPKYSNRTSLSLVMETISTHCDIKNKEELVENLKKILEGKIVDDLEIKSKKLSEFLKAEKIKLKVEAENWQEAIREVGRILVENGDVDEKYIETMIDKVEKHGSYIVVTDFLAIPHGELSQNVKNSGMALISLNKTIMFPENKPVKFLLAFCATASKDYLDALTSFLELVDNYDFLKIINSTTSIKKVLDTIKKYEFLSNVLSEKK